MTLPELAPPQEERTLPRSVRPVAMVAVVGGGACLLAVITGLVLLGLHTQGTNEVAITGLASIGATLAGGFAGWIGRGQVERYRASDEAK